MGTTIYLTGMPGPSGTLDYPTLGQFPVDVGVDPVDLHVARGQAYLLKVTLPDPDTDIELAGPPFPAGMIDYPTPFQVQWPGARRTIWPAASIGRSTSSSDTPADTFVPGALSGASINFASSLFEGIDPAAAAATTVDDTGPNVRGGGGGGLGAIVLLDPTGELDDLIGLGWDSADLEVLRGDPDAAFSTYETVARLTTAGLLYDRRKKEIRLRDLGWQMAQSGIHDEVYGGTGGLDGDAALKGQDKPYGVGPVFNVSPPQLVATLGIHQLSCSSILAVDAVRDGGSALAFDADYPTYDALAAATVPSAHYATCLAKGLIRRGSPIVYALTVDFRGDNDTIEGSSYPSTRAQIVRRIATGRGQIRLTDAQLDFASLNRLDREQAATVGFWWDNNPTKAEALDEVMAGCLGWWCVRLDGRLAAGFLADPDQAPALVLNWPEDFVGDPEQLNTWQAPRRATFVGYRRNYTVQDSNQLDGASIDADLGLIYGQATRWAGTTEAFQSWLWSTAPTTRVFGGFDSETTANSEALRAQRFFSTRRERWLVKTPVDPFADFIGKIVQINGFDRYDWGDARKFICVARAFGSGRAVSLELLG